MPSLRSDPLYWAYLALPLAVMAGFFITPLVYLFYVSLHGLSATELYGTDWTFENYRTALTDPFYFVILKRTLGSVAIILAIALVVGYTIGYVISRMPAQLRLRMTLVLLFPLMVSNVVRAYGWVAILGRQGVVNDTLSAAGLIDSPLSILYTQTAVVLGFLTILLPYMVISIANSLSNIDESYREAAQSLGANPVQTFFHVTWPLSAPGVASGLILVLLLTLSAYVTVSLLGGPRYKMLVSMIYDNVMNFRWPQAAASAFVLLGVALIGTSIILAVIRPGRVQGARK